MSPRVCFRHLTAAGFVDVRGEDAEAFLHAQLSQRIRGLPSDRAPLAGWHDARGRVRALARVLRTDAGWLLITPRASAQALRDGLRLYVLRSRIELALPDPSTLGIAAIVGSQDEWLAARGVELGTKPGALAHAGGLHWIRIGPELTHVVGPPARLEPLAESLPPAPEALPEVAEIRLGLPAVTPQIAGRYVAQMLNLDVLDAIAFDKGCFPGQEIIARAHHLGSVKRRLRRFSAALPDTALPDTNVPSTALPDTALPDTNLPSTALPDTPPPDTPPGSEIRDAAGAPAGEVIRAATLDGRTELLAVVRLDALEGELRLAGQPLRAEPLPASAA